MKWQSIAVLSAVALGGMSAQADIIYRETFPKLGDNLTAESTGWTMYAGPQALRLIDSSGSTPQFKTSGTGITGLAAINSFPATGSVDGRIYFYSSNNSSHTAQGLDRFLLSTSEYEIDQSQWDLDSVSWYMRNADTFTGRVALRVGGTWYVSSTAATTGTAVSTGDGSWVPYTYAVGGADWLPITFSPGGTTSPAGGSLTQTLSGTLQALPAGTITGFGVYGTPGTANAIERMDVFEISATAVPEPAVMLTIGMGALCLLQRRRCR